MHHLFPGRLGFKDRRVILGIIALIVLLLLTLAVAPHRNPATMGSSFSRSVDGYGAWYHYMEKQGTPVRRWQKPSNRFVDSAPKPDSPTAKTTLLQVNPANQPSRLTEKEKAWLKQGHTIVVLGIPAPVTEASFTTWQPSPEGAVKIDTTRRHKLQPEETQLLGDRHGAIVWQEKWGQGQLIQAVTPFLAANAYQDQAGNFALLAQLVNQQDNDVWIDEYLHGYKEPTIAQTENAKSWEAYLLKPPLLAILVQGLVLLGLFIWAQNRRLGQPISYKSAPPTNSEAYIQALAGVLHQAGRSEFVVDTVGRAEQLALQRSLGLGTTVLDLASLTQAWKAQVGESAIDLRGIFAPDRPQRLSDSDLLQWLQQHQQVRQRLLSQGLSLVNPTPLLRDAPAPSPLRSDEV